MAHNAYHGGIVGAVFEFWNVGGPTFGYFGIL